MMAMELSPGPWVVPIAHLVANAVFETIAERNLLRHNGLDKKSIFD
jgi:hypothetical protein